MIHARVDREGVARRAVYQQVITLARLHHSGEVGLVDVVPRVFILAADSSLAGGDDLAARVGDLPIERLLGAALGDADLARAGQVAELVDLDAGRPGQAAAKQHEPRYKKPPTRQGRSATIDHRR